MATPNSGHCQSTVTIIGQWRQLPPGAEL